MLQAILKFMLNCTKLLKVWKSATFEGCSYEIRCCPHERLEMSITFEVQQRFFSWHVLHYHERQLRLCFATTAIAEE